MIYRYIIVFIIFIQSNCFTQCSIIDYKIFNFGETSFKVLSNIYSNNNFTIKDNNTHDVKESVKDPNKGSLLRAIKTMIKKPICLQNILTEQWYELKLLNDKLYTQKFSIEFKPENAKEAKAYLNYLRKDLETKYKNYKYEAFDLKDKDTQEIVGEIHDYVLNSQCEKLNSIAIEFNFKYKFIMSNRSITNTGEIDYFKIEITFTDLNDTNFDCNHYIE